MFMDERINYSVKDYDLANVANMLYTARMNMGLSQQDFAKYLGISSSAYGRHESGKVKWISSKLIKSFCEKFNIPIDKVIVPISKEGEKRNFYNWVRRDDAQPYLEKAYQEWLEDRRKKITDNLE